LHYCFLNKKEMLYITRKENFNAAHRLYNENWSDEKNIKVFGKCSNKNWHGHNYELYVTIKGNVDAETGFVMDMKILSNIIKRHVISFLDHTNLSLDVSFLKDVNPTAENLVMKIWEQLDEPIKKYNSELHRIKLYETNNNIVEYYGE